MDGGSLVAKLCPTLGTPWTVACWAALSMGFSMHEYWSGLPCVLKGDLQDPGIEPASPVTHSCIAGEFFTTEPPGKPKERHIRRDTRQPVLSALSAIWRHNSKQVLTRRDVDVLFVSEEEILSQSVLQPDVVSLLSRHFAVPIIHQAVEFSVEFQERVLSGGNVEGKN